MSDNNQKQDILSKLTQARVRYAEEWGKGNAQKFSVEGYYSWMAGFLNDCSTVLEVGVGNGSSTLALLDAGLTVIGIDENPACLEEASKSLATMGISVTPEHRGNVDTATNNYSISYRTPRSPFPENNNCLLLEGDIMNDKTFLEWLESNGSIDAIVCWLMGTYQERTFNSVLAGTGIKSPAGYRSKVQEHICKISDRLLSTNGKVHIVDRCLLTANDSGALPGSPVWLQQCRQAYINRASGTNLKVISVDFLDYTEPDEKAAPAVKLTRSLSGDNPDKSDKAFVSIVLQHP